MTTSCSKNTTTTPTPTPITPTPSYTFSAMGITAAGVQYTISNQTAGPLKITGTTGNGTGGNDQSVVITINSVVNSVGTYTLSSSTNNTGVYTSGTNSIRYSTNTSPNVGTLTISKYDAANRVMSVSFSFNAQQYYPTVGSSANVYGSFTNVGF
ncbi:MAG: DUF6252 family protein [Bacteroidia bacterium]